MFQELTYSVLAVAGLLAAIGLVPALAERLSLPSSLVLAVLGIGLGLLVESTTGFEAPGILGDFIIGVAGIDVSAEILLFVFLPALLFAGGLTIDVRRLFDDFAAIFTLAVVAVIVCTLTVGLALEAVSTQSLVVCLLVGAVVSATDPTAVVALFRDLGAPRRLSILVEGESLFNDAAAIALFTIFVGVIADGKRLDLAEAALEFLVGFGGGLAVGLVLARATCMLIGLVRGLPVAEITLTFALAWLSYVIAQSYLGVSGVVAVVTAALFIASSGRTHVSADTWDSLVQTWEQVNFWAASLIFVLAAFFVPSLLADADLGHLGLLAAVVVATLAARALVVYGLLPGLSLIGTMKPLKTSYNVVLLWGGLRGAVTLALALSVIENPLIPAAEEHFVVTLATGLVLFTIFVNGPSLRPLLRLTGLDRLEPVELALRKRVIALSRDTVHRRVEEVAEQYGIDRALVDRVPLPDPERLPDREGGASGKEPGEDTMRNVGLVTLATREEELYLEHFRERTLSRRRVSRGLAQAGRIADAVRASGLKGYREATSADQRYPRMLSFALWLHRLVGWSWPVALRLADYHEALIVRQLVVRELLKFNETSVRPLLGPAVCTTLADALGERLLATRRALAALELIYPHHTDELRSRTLARSALRLEEAEYRLKHRESLISNPLYRNLMADIGRRRQALARPVPLDLGLGLANMIGRVPLFAAIERERRQRIARCLQPRLAVPGERIVARGERGDAMYFIAAGEVEVRLPNEAIRLGTGAFFGELALITRRRRSADVAAVGFCHLLVLKRRDFRRLLRHLPEVRGQIEAEAGRRLDPGLAE